MRHYISIFWLLILMSGLMTTSGCILTYPWAPMTNTISVSTHPTHLLSNEGYLVSDIRYMSPGFIIRSTFGSKYIHIALVQVRRFSRGFSSSARIIYLDSRWSSSYRDIIDRQRWSNRFWDSWNVGSRPDRNTTYYIYIWATREPHKGMRSGTSYLADPTTIFNALTRYNTVLGVASSGSNKYYVKGH